MDQNRKAGLVGALLGAAFGFRYLIEGGFSAFSFGQWLAYVMVAAIAAAIIWRFRPYK